MLAEMRHQRHCCSLEKWKFKAPPRSTKRKITYLPSQRPPQSRAGRCCLHHHHHLNEEAVWTCGGVLLGPWFSFFVDSSGKGEREVNPLSPCLQVQQPDRIYSRSRSSTCGGGGLQFFGFNIHQTATTTTTTRRSRFTTKGFFGFVVFLGYLVAF